MVLNIPFGSVKHFLRIFLLWVWRKKKSLLHLNCSNLRLPEQSTEASNLTSPLLMARTAGWDAENDAFHLCIQWSFYPPVPAFILILPCGFWSFWNLDSCASLWSAKLLSIRAWLWVLLSGSRGLKLKRKETLSWSSPVRGTRPHSPCIDHTCL